jgi:hypothetical protein
LGSSYLDSVGSASNSVPSGGGVLRSSYLDSVSGSTTTPVDWSLYKAATPPSKVTRQASDLDDPTKQELSAASIPETEDPFESAFLDSLSKPPAVPLYLTSDDLPRPYSSLSTELSRKQDVSDSSQTVSSDTSSISKPTSELGDPPQSVSTSSALDPSTSESRAIEGISQTVSRDTPAEKRKEEPKTPSFFDSLSKLVSGSTAKKEETKTGVKEEMQRRGNDEKAAELARAMRKSWEDKQLRLAREEDEKAADLARTETLEWAEIRRNTAKEAQRAKTNRDIKEVEEQNVREKARELEEKMKDRSPGPNFFSFFDFNAPAGPAPTRAQEVDAFSFFGNRRVFGTTEKTEEEIAYGKKTPKVDKKPSMFSFFDQFEQKDEELPAPEDPVSGTIFNKDSRNEEKSYGMPFFAGGERNEAKGAVPDLSMWTQNDDGK